MDLIVSWLLFPAVLVAICTGAGLLVRELSGAPVRPALIPPLGLALITCAGSLTTATDSTAELTIPLALIASAAGFFAARPLRLPEWASIAPGAIAGLGVFLLYGAPVLLSGDATFAGYIKLDDTSTWLSLTDRIMEAGQSSDGLAPSSYEATLSTYLGAGYPIGGFLPLGIGSNLLGVDPAWTFQPYTSLLAAFLALALADLAEPLVRSGPARSAAAFVGAQPALLVGYGLWGGVKEVEAAALIALTAAVAAPLLTGRGGLRALVPVAVSAAALLAVLDAGGVVWLAPIVLAVLYALWRSSPRSALVAAGVLACIGVVFLLTVIGGGLVKGISSILTSPTEIGNLVEPLSPWQALGVWPVGDFRVHPDEAAITVILLAITAGASIVGIAFAARKRAYAVLLYVVGSVLACVALVAVGSPWVDGKALATLSPALLFAAMLGIAAVLGAGMRAEAALVALVVVGGVLASNFLGYRDANLAPRDQLRELEAIGERIDGEGPTLMTGFEPYGARHFLRDADAEGASVFRRRPIPLRSGVPLEHGDSADTDAFDLTSLLEYRTLVLRRSPTQSRPPAPYQLLDRGDFYEVWQRPEPYEDTIVADLPLGDELDPAAVPDCEEVLAIAASAGSGDSLAAVPRMPVSVLSLDATSYPDDWASEDSAEFPDPGGAGTLRAETPWNISTGKVALWLGGSVRGGMRAAIDGEQVGEVRHQLNNRGRWVWLGESDAGEGVATVELDYSGRDLHPGSGGGGFPIGPLALAPAAEALNVAFFDPAQARELCGRRWDWIELIAG